MNWNDIKNLIKEELLAEQHRDKVKPSTKGKGSGKDIFGREKSGNLGYLMPAAGGCMLGVGGGIARSSGGGSGPVDSNDDDDNGDDNQNETKIKEASVTAKDTKFNLRTGVNKNPTKLGIKIQFEPASGAEMDRDTKNALEIALQENLNDSLKQYGIQVSKDTDVPRPNVIGFFIPLAQVKNLIVEALGGKTEDPAVPAPEPETPDVATPATPAAPATPETPVTSPAPLSKPTLNEMRVRDLNEISKVVNKDDFYSFINAGNNVVRTLEESGKFTTTEAKKYLGYLVKHNIM